MLAVMVGDMEGVFMIKVVVIVVVVVIVGGGIGG